MKKTQRIDLLTTIRGSFVSFFAITMFVALGVGLFLGMHWLSGSLRGMLDRNFAAGSAHDVEITFPYGLTQDDLDELAGLEGVDEVDAGYLSFQTFSAGGAEYVARVASLPQRIDTFIEVEGTLPAQPDEIALEAGTAARLGLSLGDTITFASDSDGEVSGDLDAVLDEMQAEMDAMKEIDLSSLAEQAAEDIDGTAADEADDAAEAEEAAKAEAEAESEPEDDVAEWLDGDGMQYLNGSTYTVTALVTSPAFLVTVSQTFGTATIGTGAIDVLAWVPESAFDAGSYRGGKPYVLARSTDLAGLPYAGDAYKEGAAALLARVEELGDRLADERFDELYGMGEGQIVRAETMLEESKVTFEERKVEAQTQLEEGRSLLDEAREAFDKGQITLDDARAQLATAQGRYAQATARLNAVQALTADSLTEYQQIEADYNAAQEELEADISQRMDALAAERNAMEEEYDRRKAPYLVTIDERVAAAEQQVFRSRPDLDWTVNELTDEQSEELWALEEAILQQDAAYQQADAKLSELNAESDQAYEEYWERDDALSAEYSARYAENSAEHDAQLDALGEKISAELEAQGVPVPATIDHTNLYYLMFADGDGMGAYVEQFKNTRFNYGGRMISYNEAGALLRGLQGQIDTGSAELEELAKKIARGETQIEQGEATYQEMVTTTEQRFVVAEEQIDEGRAKLEGLIDYVWVVLPRSYNGALLYAESFAGVVSNVRWSMASLFLIVGILVCYSAISRLVHEQITRIGTKKAVGFRKREVNALFLCYTALTVAVGAVVGVLAAVHIIEPIILSAINVRFAVACEPHFALPDALLITALEFVLILGSTVVAVRGVLKMQAVELLAGEKPPSAKKRFYENWGVWKRLGLLAQTTVNNTINDTRRVGGTLIGVAGCTALIVSALTLNNNVLRSFDREYEAINHYDTVVNVELGSEAADEAQGILEDAGMRATGIYAARYSLEQPDGQRSVVTANVPMDEAAYQEFFTLIPTSEVAEGTEGVWMSEAYAEHLGAQVGDEVSLVDSLGRKYVLPITGFFEYHLISNQMVLSPTLYEEVFGVTPTTNRLLVDTAGQGTDAAVDLLDAEEGFITATDDYAANEVNFTDFARLSKILVAVYLVLAVLMAACVLLNLDFMFVDEKKRELIVLMINGYSLRDAKGYIWHDSVLLTLLGIVLGLVLGGVVGRFTVLSAEQVNSSFVHGVSWPAMGIGVAGSAILAIGALIIALRRIGKFDLTDINRF